MGEAVEAAALGNHPVAGRHPGEGVGAAGAPHRPGGRGRGTGPGPPPRNFGSVPGEWRQCPARPGVETGCPGAPGAGQRQSGHPGDRPPVGGPPPGPGAWSQLGPGPGAGNGRRLSFPLRSAAPGQSRGRPLRLEKARGRGRALERRKGQGAWSWSRRGLRAPEAGPPGHRDQEALPSRLSFRSPWVGLSPSQMRSRAR